MKKVHLGFAMLLLSLFLNSCFKNIESVEVDNWNPEVAVPLINSKISIQDMLDNFETGGYLNVDAEDFMTIVYQGEVFSLDGADVVTIPDFGFPLLDTMMTFTNTQLDFGFNLDHMKLKEGQLNYSFKSSHEMDMDVIIQIPNLKKGNVVFEYTVHIDYGGSIPVPMEGSVDISGYTFLLGEEDFVFRYMAINPNNDERVYLEEFEFELLDMEYSYVEGQIGTYNITLPTDSIVIDLFSYASGGHLVLEDPRVSLLIDNSFGLPVQIKTEVLEVITDEDNLMGFNSELDTGFDIAFPSLNEVGSFSNSVLSLEKDNSNIIDVFASNPKQLHYQFSATSNAGNTTGDFFVLDTSTINVAVDVELPMWFKASEFIAEETIDFDPSELEDMLEAEFKLITENGFPLNVGIQIYFEDDNGIVLDSLMTSVENVLDAAAVDSQGKVNASTEKIIIIPVKGERLSHFKEATKLRIKGALSTYEEGSIAVKFYTDYAIGFKLGVKALLTQ